jgi:drug/metabolite transporter (DMT)-like permease
MAVVIGVMVAMCFGSADFLGGRASRVERTIDVLFLSQICAVAGALVIAIVVGAHVSRSDILYGFAAGALNVAGLGCLYRALSRGHMAIASPVTAVTGALVPMTWGLARGERPSAVTLAGAALAILAGAVIATGHRDSHGGRLAPTVLTALAAGALLGSSLVCFAETSDRSGLWPVLAARTAAFVLVAVVALTVARAARPGITLIAGPARGFAIGAGVFDVAATALLVVAVRRGLTSVVAPLVALGPAFTVLWAWGVLHEHVNRIQVLALAIALLGLVLIAVG